MPSNWSVVTSYACRVPKGPGTLFLGSGASTADFCPASWLSADTITLTASRLDPGDACVRPVKVNGLLVYVGPCASSSNAAGITEWTIPSLGVQAVATQVGETSVDSGSSTVVGKVLHTIHGAG